VLEQNTAEGFSPNSVLRKPSRPNGRRSSYRLLNEGKTYNDAACKDAGGVFYSINV